MVTILCSVDCLSYSTVWRWRRCCWCWCSTGRQHSVDRAAVSLWEILFLERTFLNNTWGDWVRLFGQLGLNRNWASHIYYVIHYPHNKFTWIALRGPLVLIKSDSFHLGTNYTNNIQYSYSFSRNGMQGQREGSFSWAWTWARSQRI